MVIYYYIYNNVMYVCVNDVFMLKEKCIINKKNYILIIIIGSIINFLKIIDYEIVLF